jgi:hypothetical protein
MRPSLVYYFLPSALPPLTLGIKPDISFKEFREMLLLNLTLTDLKKLDALLAPIDLYNVKALWLRMPLDDKGTIAARDLEESLLVRDSIPPYLVEFLEQYDATADRLRNFSSLYASLYRREWDGFLGKYYQFERELRLILTALRAKRAGRDLVRELQFEDPYDPLVAQILAQKDGAEYTPPIEYEELKTLFVDNSLEPEKLAFALLKYRFDKIEEMEENELFTIDHVLGYAARLLIVESWDQLDREKGSMAMEELSRYG